MEFKSVSVNNCYILGEEVFDTRFFTYFNAKAIYSASIFHLAFFKGKIQKLDKEKLRAYEKLSIDLYRLNSPYLYIPFEINYHEDVLYQSYYESDHFPLSLWLEEKSLIPFDILIQLMEDVLNGLKSLEKVEHSHLFLTPEEILIPLHWKAENCIKIYNIGLNSVVHSILNDNEIYKYRNIYYQKKENPIEHKLIKNISDDLYAFGKIINKIIPICKFNNDSDQNIIQESLNKIIDNPDSFKSIDEAKELFKVYFDNRIPSKTLTNNSIDYTYIGQASFDIPEFDEWTVEAELEPFIEEEEDSKNIINKDLNKKSIFKSLSSIFINFFKGKKRSKFTSKTMVDYSVNLDKDMNKELLTEKPIITTDIAKTDHNDKSITIKTNPSNSSTANILKDIENHYTKIKSNTKENKSITNTSIKIEQEQDIKKNKTEIEHRKYSKSESLLNKNYIPGNEEELLINFSKLLAERDYSGTEEIIKKSNILEKHSKKDISREMINLIDSKLKQLNDHYIKSDSFDLKKESAKHDSVLPLEDRKLNSGILKKLKKEIQKNKNKKTNLFLRLLLYIKSTFHNLFNK